MELWRTIQLPNNKIFNLKLEKASLLLLFRSLILKKIPTSCTAGVNLSIRGTQSYDFFSDGFHRFIDFHYFLQGMSGDTAEKISCHDK